MISSKRVILPFAFAALLSGCAVMTVDVDVYKGPLANHDDVIMEQTAAMAVGAQPLLDRLWKSIDRRCKEIKGPSNASTACEEMRSTIKAVLNLYKNRSEMDKTDRLRSLGSYALELSNATEKSFGILRPKMSSQLPVYAELLTKLERQDSGDPYSQLRAAYLSFLEPGGHGEERKWRDDEAIICAARVESISSLQGSPLMNQPFGTHELDQCGQSAGFLPANLTFASLGDVRILSKHAELLFPGNASLQNMLKEEVKKVADAYFDTRKAIRELLHTALYALIHAKEVPPDQLPEEKRKFLELQVSRFIVEELLDPYAVCQASGSSTESGVTTECKAREVNILFDDLKRDASTTAQQIIEREAQYTLAARTDYDIALRKYGFAIGPKEVDVADVNRVVEEMNSYLQSLGEPLGRGRPEAGLMELIERYLAAAGRANQGPCGSDGDNCDAGAARRTLLDALIGFAQKMLFIANHERLFSENVIGKDKSEVSIRTYIRVLQAIGNSILVHVDDIRNREAYASRMETGKDSQKSAIGHIADVDGQRRTPSSKVIKLGNAEGHGSDALKVFDELIDVLEVNKISAELYGDEAERDRATRALIESYRQRANMIYIRPAMAYLRTSYAASTLQDNQVEWRNLLSQHGLRALLGYTGEDRESLEITSELDTQFWQNINRVRVAGAGQTNYVIAKDDIGNWYVKGYETNVEDIVNSAKNLALFAAGGGLIAPAESESEDGKAQIVIYRETPLGSKFEEFQTAYLDQAAALLKDARKSVERLKSNLAPGLKVADTPTYEDVVKLASGNSVESRLPSDSEVDEVRIKRPAELPGKLADALQAIYDYYFQVYLKLGGLTYPDPALDAAAAQKEGTGNTLAGARSRLAGLVLDQELKPLLVKAQDAAKDYNTKVHVLGQLN